MFKPYFTLDCFTPAFARCCLCIAASLEKPGTAHQTDLFDDTPPAEKSRLYAAVDALNARYGKGKVFSAAQGLGTRSWHMKRQKLSSRPTTRWDELMTVR